MKVRFFKIDTDQLPENAAPGPQTLTVPGLEAYAIQSAELQYNGVTHLIDDEILRLNGNQISALDAQFCKNDLLRVCVHYYGIRDYALLFPAINSSDPDRAERIGQFYEEAENNFDTGSWMSFMLMSAAIFEHLLFFKLGYPTATTTLRDLSLAARSQGLITSADFAIVNSTREARNVIHCNRMNMPYITRKDALDARALIEKLMMRL